MVAPFQSNITAPVAGSAAPSSIATPVKLAANFTPVSTLVITAIRPTRVTNTGTVYIGISSTNDTQLIPLAPGASITLNCGPKTLLDVSTLWVDATTATDGVCWLGI